jgi:hypothetical protein
LRGPGSREPAKSRRISEGGPYTTGASAAHHNFSGANRCVSGYTSVGGLMMSRVLLALLVISACDGPDDSGEDIEPIGLIGENVPWVDKTDDEKHSWMTFRVLPQMREKFEAFDASYVGNFRCETCHGTDVESTGFDAIPQATGPAELHLSDWPSQSSDPEVQAYATFMEDEVEPLIASLLGTVVATQTQSGVSCRTCHVVSN